MLTVHIHEPNAHSQFTRTVESDVHDPPCLGHCYENVEQLLLKYVTQASSAQFESTTIVDPNLNHQATELIQHAQKQARSRP